MNNNEQYLIDNAQNNVIGYIWDLNGSIPFLYYADCFIVHHVINGIHHYMWRIDYKGQSEQSVYYYTFDELDNCCLDCYNAFKELFGNDQNNPT